jgi:membrane-associated protease RseP (regulator of RpoE activity)
LTDSHSRIGAPPDQGTTRGYTARLLTRAPPFLFVVSISVNLAILNSLPFPALDGGQLAFVIVEILARRPVPREIKDNIVGLAFVILLMLGVSTIVGDVTKLTLPTDTSSTQSSSVIKSVNALK